MSLDIRSSKIAPDILVVQLAGNLTLVPENQISQPFIADLLDSSARKLIVDLAGIEHMDSSGVQLMVQCSSVVKNAGGSLLLASASPRVARLFQITRLDSILPLYPTVASACESFTVGPT
jgi:anti-sigma B factor antagonist